ncbi:helix-turn-helix domain-containing protein [Chitinophaga costaii]|uniref:helix-turn-helix domain-containing protein n=1 Tax=Chitinophaga costaii TaxID=1335309 RepID=UPI0013FD4FA2|nr:helix-turn-helix domain-containing protein [Chitinophaga costaii]
MPPTIPKKILSRKDELTQQFLTLVTQHMHELKQDRVDKINHTSDFAAQLFVHPVHLSNTIKLTTGKSPCDHLEAAMVAEATRLLEETDLSIADIAYKLTYSAPTNFVKFYKGMTGVTPLQHRKQLKAQHT